MSAAIGAASNLIPSPFGGFAPFPNSIMIPFMGTQSAVLGYDFGLSYEAGKRMIKSMDNEDFNKFIKKGDTVSFEGTQQNLLSVFSKQHYRTMVKQFTDEIPHALQLQDTIIEASVAIELKKANRTPSAMVEIIKAFGTASANTIRVEMDKIPIIERTLIFAAVPLLALLYMLGGGKQDFVNTGPKEPEPAPILEPIPSTPTTSPTPTIAPEEPFVAPEITLPEPEPAVVYPYTTIFWWPSDTSWNFNKNIPNLNGGKSIFTIKSHDYAHTLITLWFRYLNEPLPNFSVSRKNTIQYNIFKLRQKHFSLTKHAL